MSLPIAPLPAAETDAVDRRQSVRQGAPQAQAWSDAMAQATAAPAGDTVTRPRTARTAPTDESKGAPPTASQASGAASSTSTATAKPDVASSTSSASIAGLGKPAGSLADPVEGASPGAVDAPGAVSARAQNPGASPATAQEGGVRQTRPVRQAAADTGVAVPDEHLPAQNDAGAGPAAASPETAARAGSAPGQTDSGLRTGPRAAALHAALRKNDRHHRTQAIAQIPAAATDLMADAKSATGAAALIIAAPVRPEVMPAGSQAGRDWSPATTGAAGLTPLAVAPTQTADGSSTASVAIQALSVAGDGPPPINLASAGQGAAPGQNVSGGETPASAGIPPDGAPVSLAPSALVATSDAAASTVVPPTAQASLAGARLGGAPDAGLEVALTTSPTAAVVSASLPNPIQSPAVQPEAQAASAGRTAGSSDSLTRLRTNPDTAAAAEPAPMPARVPALAPAPVGLSGNSRTAMLADSASGMSSQASMPPQSAGSATSADASATPAGAPSIAVRAPAAVPPSPLAGSPPAEAPLLRPRSGTSIGTDHAAPRAGAQAQATAIAKGGAGTGTPVSLAVPSLPLPGDARATATDHGLDIGSAPAVPAMTTGGPSPLAALAAGIGGTSPPPGPSGMAAPPSLAPAGQASAIPATATALAASVVAMSQSGRSTTILRLDPPDLGALSVHIALTGNATVNVVFVPSVPQTAQLIHGALPDLHHAMAGAGLNLGEAQVGGGANPGPNGHHAGNQGGERDRFAQTTMLSRTASETDSTSARDGLRGARAVA